MIWFSDWYDDVHKPNEKIDEKINVFCFVFIFFVVAGVVYERNRMKIRAINASKHSVGLGFKFDKYGIDKNQFAPIPIRNHQIHRFYFLFFVWLKKQ